MTTMLHHLASSCFSIFIISAVLISLLFIANRVEARAVKTRSFAPAIYRHNNNIDDFTTRLSYNTNNNNHHHKHDQPSSSSSSTLDILFCSHNNNNDKSLDDYEPIIRAESERLGHILQLSSVLDLIPASLLLQPVKNNNNNNLLLPNSQRLFQVLPSVRERVSNKNNSDDCLLIEVPLWESFACSAFIARATELVTGSRKAAAELLVKELMILNNISSSSSSSSVSVSTIIDSLEEHQNHRVVLNDPSYTTSRAHVRDAMVRSFHDRRDELDRVAALVYSALSKPKPKSSTRNADFSFELISNGKYSNYSLSLDFATEKNNNNKNNNDDNNDNEEEIEIHTSIEQTSELSAIMTVDIARLDNDNNRQQDDAGDKKLSTTCEILVRLPPHIAQLDYRYLITTTSDNDDDDDDRRPPILTFKHDGDDDGDNNKIRIFPLSQQHQHQHQQIHHHHHQHHHHVDRHWKSYWFVSPSSSSSSFTIPLRIPRLPVEAYPPDLNRLVTLPAVIGRCVGTETTTRNSDDNEINHRPPTETSIEALGVLSRSTSTSSSSYHRSINRVSLYQPGPDRAIPFVVLAFAMLVTSVLVIRTVSVVAVASSAGVIEKTK